MPTRMMHQFKDFNQVMLRTSGREAAKKATQAIAHLAAGNKSRNDSDEENAEADASNTQSTPGKSPKTKRDTEAARNAKRSKVREPEPFSDREGDSFEEEMHKSPGRAIQSKRESLFSKISSSASAIASISKQLVKAFQSNPDKGIADILCLVVEAAGLPSSKVSIRAKDIQSAEPVDFCELLCQNIKDGEFTTPFSSRPKNVKSNFRNFWLKFIREAEPMLSENEGLIFQLHEWLSTLSSSKLLSLRLAATEASLLVVTGLAKAAGTAASSANGDDEKLKSLEHFMSEFISAVFVHRFRDIDKGVRLSCIKALGEWVTFHPSMFYDNQYLKYLGWSLNDKKAEVRIQALQILKELYSTADAQRLGSFIDRFKGRIMQIASSDVDKAATSAGLQLAEQLASASIVSDDDVDKILVLLNDPEASIRDSAAQVMQSIVIEGVLLAEIKTQKKSNKGFDEHQFMIQNLCDFILNYFKEQDNLDNIVDALFPIVPSLGMWDKICEILSTYGDGDLELAQFDTLSKMLQSSINIAFGAGPNRPGKKEDRYPRSFSLNEQTLHFSVSFTEVVRRSQTDPALIAALASVPKGFKGQKIPNAAVPQFAELGSRLLDAIEANSSASTCNQLAEAASTCAVLGNSEGEASSRASVIAVEATKTKGKKSRSSTGFVDKHALMRSSALFRYFDIRESNVAQAALAVSQGDTDDEVTKFCAVEVIFLHAVWSRASGDSSTSEWFGKAIEAAFSLSESCSSPFIEASCCALIYDCRNFVEMPSQLASTINQKAYCVAASQDNFDSPALQVEHDEEIQKMGLNVVPCGSNGKLVRLAVGRYVMFNLPEAVDDRIQLNDAPISAAACVAFQPASSDWLRSLRAEIKKRIGSSGLARWDSCLMEKMFIMVSTAEGSDTQDTLAQQMELVCTKLVASYSKPGTPANQQQDLFTQVLSIVKRGLRFALPAQQDNDKIFFLEFCLAPLVSKVPEECKKLCQDLVTRHISQSINYKLDDSGDIAVDALMTALGSDAFVARVYSVQPTPTRRRSRPSLSQSSLLSARASPAQRTPDIHKSSRTRTAAVM